MIKIVFNFKYIYMHVCMNACVTFNNNNNNNNNNNLTNYL